MALKEFITKRTLPVILLVQDAHWPLPARMVCHQDHLLRLWGASVTPLTFSV